jgi:hypothetical protein
MFLLQRVFPGVKEFFQGVNIPQFLNSRIAKIKLPHSTLGRMVFCFSSELISFFVIATNFRALAKGYILWTVVTDGVIVMQNTLISKIFIENEKARDGLSTLSFTLGGMAGSALSIVLTRYIWGS